VPPHHGHRVFPGASAEGGRGPSPQPSRGGRWSGRPRAVHERLPAAMTAANPLTVSFALGNQSRINTTVRRLQEPLFRPLCRNCPLEVQQQGLVVQKNRPSDHAGSLCFSYSARSRHYPLFITNYGHHQRALCISRTAGVWSGQPVRETVVWE